MKFIGIQTLTRIFDRGLVLGHVSLTFYQGRIYGLLGSNDGGKTLTLPILPGILDHNAGKFEVLGMDPALGREQVRQIINFLPELC